MPSKDFESTKEELRKRLGFTEEVWESFLSVGEEKALVEAHMNGDTRRENALLSVLFWRENKVTEDFEEAQYWKNVTDMMKQEKQWKHIGEKLVSVLGIVFEKLKGEDAIQDYEVLPFNERKPDLIVDGDIGIEAKNWNPEDKTKMNSHNLKESVIKRFEGDTKWVKNRVGCGGWRKKILVIPKLEFGYDPGECKRLIDKHDLEVVDGFLYVNENPENFKSARVALYRKFNKLKMEGKF